MALPHLTVRAASLHTEKAACLLLVARASAAHQNRQRPQSCNAGACRAHVRSHGRLLPFPRKCPIETLDLS
eukprot:2969104-Pleurochrysis_carterae.AAC.1